MFTRRAFWIAVALLSSAARANAQSDYKLHGLDFSPYIDGQSAGTSVSETQIRARMSLIAPHTEWVRSFGVTQGLQRVGPVAREFGLKTAIGAWLGTNVASNQTSISALIGLIQAGSVDLAVVGSETLQRGDLTESQLIGYLNQVKSAAGTIPVTTADTYNMLRAHPNVIAACDVVFVNYYGYWSGISIEQAVPTLNTWHCDLTSVAGNKPIIVSETGWPSAGDTVGAAVPTTVNAARYLNEFVAWARAKGVDYFYFEAFDEAWKAADEGPQGAHWGVWDKDGVLKPGMNAVFLSSAPGPVGGAGVPAIQFSLVPPIGSTKNLQGRAVHVLPQAWKVAVYIRVGGVWWTKPTSSAPASLLRADGTWTCDITTGGNDAQATHVAAYLIPACYAPPLASGSGSLPSALSQNAVASAQYTRSNAAKGDYDLDGDVDAGDLTTFMTCLRGPAIPRTTGCAASDFDADNDVDQADFGVFQRCYSGANQQASASCGS